MTDTTQPLITPGHFRLPRLTRHLFLFYLLQHFFAFHEMTGGGKIRSYGPAKRFTFTRDGIDYSVLGGFIGAPLAAIVIENAIFSGARIFQAFGTAGSLGTSNWGIGDLQTPKKGYDETGMIHDYGGEHAETHFSYSTQAISCEAIVSVNSFYRLTPMKLAYYRNQRIDLIDMESAPLNFIARLHGVSFEPLFVISDRIVGDSSWQMSTDKKAMGSSIERGLQQLLP